MIYQMNLTMQHYDETNVILPACNSTVIIVSTHVRYGSYSTDMDMLHCMILHDWVNSNHYYYGPQGHPYDCFLRDLMIMFLSLA